MSLKGHYYKVSYCGRDSRFRLFPAQIRMYAANASIPTSGIWRRSGCQKLAAKPQYQPAESLSRLSIPITRTTQKYDTYATYQDSGILEA